MINQNYLKLPGSYLFATIGRKVKEYSEANPDKSIVRLGIGDVSLPLAPAVVKAMHEAADLMGREVKGYPDYEGYDFLRETIVEHDYRTRGTDISSDEIFVNDGAKCDSADLGDIFSLDCKVAVCDPVYPVYVDSNALVGRAGDYLTETGRWSNLIYMPCYASNNFVPEFPTENPDLIYLCFPNNPTGAAVTKAQLQEWVDYANKIGAVIIFDAAYEAYISEEDVPHTIYECEGAKTCAIEMRSFSKNAGFTGTRLGFTVIPKELVRDGVSLHTLWTKHQETKMNGVSYIVQAAGAAVYTLEGKAETNAQVAFYMKNAQIIRNSLADMGYTVSGGVNSPYVWLKTPGSMTSWEFFDYLLENANVVGTPGSGFGSCGEGYFRLTGFGSRENTEEALRRIRAL
ncbi:MAG: LL-diaminopimelate aminotransferase [Lachnospiraceae bacterium]|nr:LL-diaminopimelate aminotransferase [Lachnospiraceae bacterium]